MIRYNEKQAQALVLSLEKNNLAKYGLVKKKLLRKQGKLNFNFLGYDSSTKKYLLSIPRNNPVIIRVINKEYRGVGFFKLGGSFRLRSTREIVRLYKQCAKIGIRVPRIIDYGDYYIFREFIEGRLFQDALSDSLNASRLVISYLTQIMQMHSRGIVLGDRWGPNEIVTPDDKIVFFDFDIELKKIGKEMELAQAIYYSIQFSFRRRESAKAICAWLDLFPEKQYCWSKVAILLRGHDSYFKLNTTSYDVQYDNISHYLKIILQKMVRFAKS